MPNPKLDPNPKQNLILTLTPQNAHWSCDDILVSHHKTKMSSPQNKDMHTHTDTQDRQCSLLGKDT